MLWRYFRSGLGAGYLPDPGGLNDQSAWVIEAFGVMSAAEARIKKDAGNA